MKILIIAHDLPPLINPQAIQIGRLLYNLPAGNDVYVVTADDKNSKRDVGYYEGIYDKFNDMIKLPYYRGLLKKIFTRLFNIFFLMPDVFLYWHLSIYRKIHNRWRGIKFDAILTFPYPFSSAILGLILKKRLNVKWICFFSDPWADNPHFGYRGIAKWINLKLESAVLRNVTRVVFPSPEMRDSYIGKYPFIKDKACVLEHSFDAGMYRDISARRGGRMTVRHIGSFYKIRNARSFFEAVRNLIDAGELREDEILIELAGEILPKFRKYHMELIEKLGLGRIVRMTGAVSYTESLSLMKSSDLLLIIDAPIKGSVFLPSKLIDYIGAERPILALTPSDSASAMIIGKVGGWLAEPDDVAQISERLLEILRCHKKGTLDETRPSKEAGKEYDISNHIEKFLTIIK